MSVGVDDKIHLKVTEASAVCLGRPVVYACAAWYVGGFSGFAFAFRPSSEVRMSAVAAQFPAFIGVYDIVDGLHGHGNAFFCQHATDLFRRPLVVDNHLLYAPDKHAVEFPVGGGTLSASKCFCMSLFPQIVAFFGGIALEFAAKR